MSIWLPSRASLTRSLRRTANIVNGTLYPSAILPLLLRGSHLAVSNRRVTPTIVPTARRYASSSPAEENRRSGGLVTKDNRAVVSDSQGASSSVHSKAIDARQPFATRAWAKIKHEVNHYWDGTKLLGAEIKISWRLLRRLLKGKQLTRRERRQVSGGSARLL
jgi:hypothetical protein